VNKHQKHHIYEGNRAKDGTVSVLVDGEPLPPCNDVYNHSPDGFEWGYGGSGPAQLALALLVHHCGKNRALKYYQDFKWRFISILPKDEIWKIESEDLDYWILLIDGEQQHV